MELKVYMKKIYDVGIIGAGVAGCFAALRASEYEGKFILFELGRPPIKRRRQLEGWLGCLPGSDGKFYLNDKDKVKPFVDGRKSRHVYDWILSNLESSGPLKLTSNKLPTNNFIKKAESLGYQLNSSDFFQWKPENIHKFSKYISNIIEDKVDLVFDNEAYHILKKKNYFQVITESGDYYCNKLLLCVGRGGWRWANKIFKDFGLLVKDDTVRVGIRVEIAAQYVKDLNKSHCSLSGNNLEIGPFCWNGTVIPEDHADLAISSFRSNENRWHTDKVSFNLMSNKYISTSGVDETERLAKLAFLLFNDRVGRDKIKSLLRKESPISALKEYDWLEDAINNVNNIITSTVNRGYYYSPSIITHSGEININYDFETDVKGLFVAGESAGIFGLLAAALSGTIAFEGAING
jgi:hypothetical protein